MNLPLTSLLVLAIITGNLCLVPFTVNTRLIYPKILRTPKSSKPLSLFTQRAPQIIPNASITEATSVDEEPTTAEGENSHTDHIITEPETTTHSTSEESTTHTDSHQTEVTTVEESTTESITTEHTTEATPEVTHHTDATIETTTTGDKNAQPIVHTNEGSIRGIVREVEDSQPVYFFEGIRYGTAERFQRPKATEPWTDTYNAVGVKFACPQAGIDWSDKATSNGYSANSSNEDCLYLNIWQPFDTRTPLPVMVWIHGGGFMLGTIFSETFDARYLSSIGNVVVVSIQYRLGFFGFLYADTEDAPGNQGLYDQILALKWVQANIHHFGGDPTKVTLFGQSAGSMSVGALVLSPLAKGLFKRAILQSGVPNSYLGSHDKDQAIEQTKQLGALLCPNENAIDDILQCLRDKSVDEISQAELHDPALLLNPIYGDEVMPESPVEALKLGKFNHDIDLMYGVVRDEGSAFVGSLIKLFQKSKTEEGLSLNEAKEIIKGMMGMHDSESVELNEIVDFYTKNVDSSDQVEIRNAIENVFGDYHLVCPTVLFGEQYARMSAVTCRRRIYSYRLVQPLSIEIGYGCHMSMGVCHAMDIAYIFGMPIRFRGIPFTEAEYQLSHDMILAWSSFALTGFPGNVGDTEWKSAVTFDGGLHIITRHMELVAANYTMVTGYFTENCDAFWKPKIFS